jgi:hypothetical protein
MRASSEARPVGSVSRVRASLLTKALGRNPSVVRTAAFGFMQIRLLFAFGIVTPPIRVVKGEPG